MFINGYYKEEPGDHSDYQESRQLREQMHSGRLNIKQSVNVALSAKQHTGCRLALQIVREREQKQDCGR